MKPQGIKVYETNLDLGYNELAYFIHYKENSYLCIDGADYNIGELINFLESDKIYLIESKYKLEFSRMYNQYLFEILTGSVGRI